MPGIDPADGWHHPIENYSIVHQDAELVAVDKPAGLPVVAERGPAPRRPLAELLAERLGRRVWVVHRLDAVTSGLVVFALSAEAHRRLCAAFETRAVRKLYLAVVAGAASDGSCAQPLKEFGSGRVAPAADGKPSRTRWRLKRRVKDASLLEVEPETGRRHQIRAHLNAAGHPVLGDPLYGPPPRPVGGAPRLMLHAWRLELPGGLLLKAPPPPDFVHWAP